jgi:4-hydroxy-tetrahydrodipicolinate synthase
MYPDGAVDFDALDRLIDFHIEAGTNALVVAGTTGESATLSTDEQAAVIRHVVPRVRGKVPVLAGTGTASTATTITLSRQAMASGADGCLVVTPYYNKPTQEGLYRHYLAVAEAVPLPVVLYNVPGRTACDLAPETIERLADVPNIVGIKEATGSVARAADIQSRTGRRIDLYSGDDPTACELMLAGARGVISVTANVAPALMARMCAAALAGDAETAAALDAKLVALHESLFVESNPIPAKWALHAMGLIGPTLRLPLTPMSAAHQEQVRTALAAADITVQ